MCKRMCAHVYLCPTRCMYSRLISINVCVCVCVNIAYIIRSNVNKKREEKEEKKNEFKCQMCVVFLPVLLSMRMRFDPYI